MPITITGGHEPDTENSCEMISSPSWASKSESSSLARVASQSLSEDSPCHRRQLEALVDGSLSRSDRDFTKQRSDCDFSGRVATTPQLTSSGEQPPPSSDGFIYGDGISTVAALIWMGLIQSELKTFGPLVQLEPPFHPLYSKPKWVYCSPQPSLRFCLVSLVACSRISSSSIPAPMCCCQWRSCMSSIASTICEVAGALVSDSPPSLRLAFRAQNTPTSLASYEAPYEELEATSNPLEDYPLFPSSETSSASR
ncbi:hypothetical protein TIFTF001_031737 [Ficus carica]|uniref:Uncharacterized protein n=1 Tax=Ficus carica TaxID=3494 RepID=A0AA88J1H9_FICCA|nr:hypothetical protein TIFTF001_031737 [Ficus carica]